MSKRCCATRSKPATGQGEDSYGDCGFPIDVHATAPIALPITVVLNRGISVAGIGVGGNMRAVRIAVLAIVVIVIAGAAGVILSDQLTQPAPPDPATFIARAARYQANIRRDEFGVPHIRGRTDADVAFGFGFAHSEDDFATIQDVALACRGQLAATEGLKAATTDYLVHLFRVWETINIRYERDLPADVRKVVEAYADGVNYYAALHPDRVKAGLLPLTGKDIVAGFVFKTPFFYGLDKTLRDIEAPPSDTQETGSNGVAVAPQRSADGATRLLVNSHQPYSGPVAW
jgi:acyl-homoserine-lactone acylase